MTNPVSAYQARSLLVGMIDTKGSRTLTPVRDQLIESIIDQLAQQPGQLDTFVSAIQKNPTYRQQFQASFTRDYCLRAVQKYERLPPSWIKNQSNRETWGSEFA